MAELELGLFTSGYQRYPLEQAFEDASRFGYDYIELWGGYPHACGHGCGILLLL